MLAGIDSHHTQKIEAGMNSDTAVRSKYFNNHLLTKVNVREDEAIPQMKVENIQHSSFLFKKHDNLEESDVTVLEENKYLVNDMVI